MGSDIERLLDDHDATAIAAAIRSGEVDAGDVVATSIARAEERNPALNALVTTRFDRAAAESSSVDREAPFAGVPFVVKDLGAEVAGLPQARGSRLFADDVSYADSELVRRYRSAGLIILGTTNTPEPRPQRLDRAGAQRADPQPARPRSFGRRFLGRHRRGGGGGDRAVGPRQRWRRFDPHSVVGLWAVRVEAISRTGQRPPGSHAVGRPDGLPSRAYPLGARLGGAAGPHRRLDAGRPL